MSKHTESALQQACVRYFRTQFPQYSKLLIAIPNHAVLRGDAVQRARQWKRLEAEGAVTGAADLMLFRSREFVRPGYLYVSLSHGCFFELKTSTGKQSPAQREFQKQVEA